MLSEASINNKFNKLSRDKSLEYKFDERVINQIKKEKKILNETQNVCLLQRNTYLQQLDKEETVKRLKELSVNNFYNSDVFEIMQCFINSIILTNESYSIPKSIHRYFYNLKQIGSDSANGVALKSSLKDEDNFFVIKAPKNPKNFNDLIHESFVALKGTNSLRKKIPNFSYVYGIISCTAPILKGKEVQSWCMDSESSNVFYSIYENINNNIAMRDYITNCTAEQFMMIFIQVMYALKIAAEDINFTHYDLHYENVILRPMGEKEKIYIKYESSITGNSFVFCEKYVATIIDYGMSNIKYPSSSPPFSLGGEDLEEEENYGNISEFLDDLNITNKCNIIFDVYKFLLFSFLGMKESKNNSYNILKPLFNYFDTTDYLDTVLDTQWPSRYAIPFLSNELNFDINDWINYCINFCNEKGWVDIVINNSPGNDNILQCQNGECSENYTKDFKVIDYENNLPKTFPEIYDLIVIMYYNNSDNLDNFKTLIENNMPNLINDYIILMDNIFEKIDGIANGLNYIKMIDDVDAVVEEYNEYLNNFYNMVKLIELVKEYILNYNACNLVIKYFEFPSIEINNNIYYNILNIKNKYLDKIYNLLVEYEKILTGIKNKISTLNKNRKNFIKEDEFKLINSFLNNIGIEISIINSIN